MPRRATSTLSSHGCEMHLEGRLPPRGPQVGGHGDHPPRRQRRRVDVVEQAQHPRVHGGPRLDAECTPARRGCRSSGRTGRRRRTRPRGTSTPPGHPSAHATAVVKHPSGPPRREPHRSGSVQTPSPSPVQGVPIGDTGTQRSTRQPRHPLQRGASNRHGAPSPPGTRQIISRLLPAGRGDRQRGRRRLASEHPHGARLCVSRPAAATPSEHHPHAPNGPFHRPASAQAPPPTSAGPATGA